MPSICETSDLIVFSHLRWDFIFQRPQHLLTKFAKYRRVYYFEDPIYGMTDSPRLFLKETSEGVQVVIPYLPENIDEKAIEVELKYLVDELIFDENISKYTAWYCTPTSLPYTRHIQPETTIYDCLDEYHLEDLEAELMKKADLVFTAGLALFDGKKQNHDNIHSFPNSIDYEHFAQGRLQLVEPDDQVNIPRPRIGYYGTIDERFDLELLEQMARKRPEFQFIIIGPVKETIVDKIPRLSNIFYLEKKDYHTLPLYLSGWDCAMTPYMLNDHAKFNNPTKIIEFLAAGKPVVSTAINEMINAYADRKMVHIAFSPDEFLQCLEKAMEERNSDPEWINRIDSFLTVNTWEHTFTKMAQLESELRT